MEILLMYLKMVHNNCFNKCTFHHWSLISGFITRNHSWSYLERTNKRCVSHIHLKRQNMAQHGFFLQVYFTDFHHVDNAGHHTELSRHKVGLPHSPLDWRRSSSLLVHGFAVSFILVGGDHLVHTDSHRGQDAVQLLHGLLRQRGLSAQDPGQLHVE